MRIVHLLTTNAFSGAESVACKIIELYKRDSSVEMVYCSPRGQIESFLRDKKIDYYPLKSFSIKNVRKALQTLKPDIVHAHDFRASFFMALLSKNYRFVSHIHNNAVWIRKKCLFSRLFLYTAKRASKVVNVSDSIIKEYVYGPKIADKCVTLSNPIDIKDIRNKALLNCFSEKYNIVFCGRLSKEKGPLLFVDLMTEVLKKHPDYKIAIIGAGPLEESVSTMIKERGLSQISMLGFLSNPYPVIKNSSIICIPSEYEGFGLVAVEAICLGVPVVCSGAGGLASIVTPNVGFICQNKNNYIDSFEKLSDKTTLERYSSSCLEEANRFDNLVSYKKQLGAIYNYDVNE